MTKFCLACGSLCSSCNNANTCSGCINPEHTLNQVSFRCECATLGYILLENGNCYNTNPPVIPNECAGKPYILITNGSCVVNCPLGTYLEATNNKFCLNCGLGCTECSNSGPCTTC